MACPAREGQIASDILMVETKRGADFHLYVLFCLLFLFDCFVWLVIGLVGVFFPLGMIFVAARPVSVLSVLCPYPEQNLGLRKWLKGLLQSQSLRLILLLSDKITLFQSLKKKKKKHMSKTKNKPN